MKQPRFNLFAQTAPGLEAMCAAELEALDLAGVRPVAGGVEFCGSLREVYLANLWSRTAGRILVRVGEVRSRDFPDLFRKAVRLPWGRFVRPDVPVTVRAASHRSRLHHTGRIAETLAAAVDRALGRQHPVGGFEQLVLARFVDDVCHLSVDSSGERLHRRGYRRAAVPAPVRENLAAAVLLRLGWKGDRPLLDPLCGSGTFPIEAALLAAGKAPGRRRTFAFMNWPRYRPGLWEALGGEAERAERRPDVAIGGADRSPQAVAAARANAERAGVAEMLTWHCRELTEAVAPAPTGLLVANPPYGQRLGTGADLPGWYRNFGGVVRRRFPGWEVALLCPDPALVRAADLAAEPVLDLVSGGLSVTLYRAEG